MENLGGNREWVMSPFSTVHTFLRLLHNIENNSNNTGYTCFDGSTARQDSDFVLLGSSLQSSINK